MAGMKTIAPISIRAILFSFTIITTLSCSSYDAKYCIERLVTNKMGVPVSYCHKYKTDKEFHYQDQKR